MVKSNSPLLPIVEADFPRAETGLGSVTQWKLAEQRVSLDWRPDGPTVRFKDLLKILRISRSKAYQLMQVDKTFPRGTPLYDSPRSPKFYWVQDAIVWLEARSNKFLPTK